MSIVIATEIDIDATPDQVWEVLADFLSYGEWSNFSKVDGEPRLGGRAARSRHEIERDAEHGERGGLPATTGEGGPREPHGVGF